MERFRDEDGKWAWKFDEKVVRTNEKPAKEVKPKKATKKKVTKK